MARIRAKASTKVFTTPMIRLIVTISPWRMCVISWPATAANSSSLREWIILSEKAISALFLVGPVAKALGEGDLNIPTSGISILLSSAILRTTLRMKSSLESVVVGSISLTLYLLLAMDLLSQSEINEPPNPIMAQKPTMKLTSSIFSPTRPRMKVSIVITKKLMSRKSPVLLRKAILSKLLEILVRSQHI